MINTRLANWLPPVVLFVLVIVIWDLGLLALGVQSFLLPRPTVIWAKLLELWPTTLARGVAFTASEALGGLAAGIVLGTAAGLALSPRLLAASKRTDPDSWALLADTHLAAVR